tara:strand:- start:80 stop:751 length:672 start_codon:yes stop_codon:yes gene_type:complete
MKRKNFLEKQIKKFINVNSSIIVFGGGQMENEIFENNNFKNVSFLNIDHTDLSNIKFNKIIASMNNNNLENNSFDFAIANASIHHSSKPHLSILEMYRVAKDGVLILEGNDSLLMNIATKLGYSEIFEKSAIQNNTGGVDNSSIPNFIYRWNEKEIYKLISSYKPDINHRIIFDYSYDLGNVLKQGNYLTLIIKFIFKIFFKLFKKQQNLMSIYINIKDSVVR